jgi:uncharacterized protein
MMNKWFHWDALQIDREIAALSILSTLLLLLNAYHSITPIQIMNEFGTYFLIPLLVVIFVFRKQPKEYGFGWGDWKTGIAITGFGILLIAPVIWLLVHADSNMRMYYSGRWNLATPFFTLLSLWSWEFFFRGWLLFGYARKFGANALWLQAVPFALMHITKPEIETMSTIFGGFAFGWIAWRTRSFLYPFLLHWFISTFTILVASGAFS